MGMWLGAMFLYMFLGLMRERNDNRFSTYTNQLFHGRFEFLNMFQHFTAQYDVKRISLKRKVLNIYGLSIYIVYLIRSIACFLGQITTFYVRVEKMPYHRAFIAFRTAQINEAFETKVG